MIEDKEVMLILNRDKVELFSLDVVKTEMVKVFNKVICGSNDSIQIG